MLDTKFVDGFDDSESYVGFPGSDGVVVAADETAGDHLLSGEFEFGFRGRVAVVGVDVDPS